MENLCHIFLIMRYKCLFLKNKNKKEEADDSGNGLIEYDEFFKMWKKMSNKEKTNSRCNIL
jgi:hypothetical protein